MTTRCLLLAHSGHCRQCWTMSAFERKADIEFGRFFIDPA
jgi:hypothetical protein